MRDHFDFRHSPCRSVLADGASPLGFLWDVEPVVHAMRRLTADRTDTGMPTAVPISSSPAVVAGVGVIVASDDGYVRFYSRNLDKIFWQRRINGPVYASLVVHPERRQVFVVSTRGLVVALDLRGNLVWSRDLDAPVFATPAVSIRSGLLVLAVFGGRCVALKLESGEIRYDVALPRPWHAGISPAAARDPYASPAIAEDGRAVVGCAEHLVCIDEHGERLWQFNGRRSMKASPIIYGERVFACDVSGACRVFSLNTGEQMAGAEIGGKITASPAFSGGILAVGTADGRVVGFDGRNCTVSWTTNDGGAREYTSLTTLPNGDFVMTNARGNIHCMGAHDGRFIWESSQVLGLPDHEPSIDITPVACPSGMIYACSYEGYLYAFTVRPTA